MQENMVGGSITMNIKVANVNRNIQAINDNFGLNDKQVIVYTVTEEDMSEPNAYTQDKFFIESSVVTKMEATLRVSSVYDVMDVRLPKRYFYRSYCRFRFKDGDCQYAGTAFDCNKTFQRCQELENERHFGAFPSIPVQRLLVE
jgi:phage-related protein